VRPHPATALQASFDFLQIPAVIGDGVTRGGQQRSQVRLGQQVAFDLQDQPRELGAIGNGHTPTLPASVARALY